MRGPQSGPESDLEKLRGLGFIRGDERGVELVHDLVAQYASRVLYQGDREAV